jgi:hypothetical protein
MASVILGEWTHRRGDPGGARAVAAEIDRPKPAVAWSWRPEHGGRVDQVRVVGQHVVVATMAPREAAAPGWEHATIYLLEARTGAEVARRILPDPVPVAAMIVHAGQVHVIATRRGEPVFWYSLSPHHLAAHHRRVVALADDVRHDDVLDAWGAPDGGLWLELEGAFGAEGRSAQAYALVDGANAAPASCAHEEACADSSGALARDACAGEGELFAPVSGYWNGASAPVPPRLSRLDARRAGEQHGGDTTWASASLAGPNASIHAVGNGELVCAVAVAEDDARPRRARVEAFGVERATGVVKWRAQGDRVALRPPLGELARVVRRPSGEILFQALGAEGTPCTPLVCARPDGRLDTVVLGARGRYVLDAALGDTVLVHRENKEGAVEVGGFAVDNEGRLLGRRAVARWTIDAGNLGGGTTVYAGAGAVVVRGARGICAVRL